MSRGNRGTTSVRLAKALYGNESVLADRTVFMAHEADSGDTYIDLLNMTMPSVLSGRGYSNPSTNMIQKLRLSTIQQKVKVVSSSRGELMKISWYINGSNQIVFDGFTAEQDEIFEITVNTQQSGASLVDARALGYTKTMTAGETDIVVPDMFEYNKNPSSQVGAVMVFKDTDKLNRNVGNATAAPSADGDYEEVPGLNGVTNLIRLNNSVSGGEVVTVVSVGSLVERAEQSMLSYIEHTNGALQSVIETVALLAGVDESTFNAPATSVDLNTYGSRVAQMWTLFQSIVNYEEGSSTIYLKEGTNNLATGNCYYTRFGDLVYVSINFENITPGGATGALTIADLPFVARNDVGGTAGLVFRGERINTGVTGDLHANTVGNQSYINLRTVPSAGSVPLALTASMLSVGNNSDINVVGFYKIKL